MDILCSLGPMLSESEWYEKGMHNYGLVAVSSNAAAQVEKVDHATAVKLLANLGEIKSVGASLGSFSVSASMLFALLEEFEAELMHKKGKLDSDPHLWMPMTLHKEAYIQLMSQKGISIDNSGSHFDRIENMMNKFSQIPENNILKLFGAVDVGIGFQWWDFGQLQLYQRSNQTFH